MPIKSMSNGQSNPDDVPLDPTIESEEILRRLIEYDEALAAGLTDSIEDEETLRKLNPETRRQVGEIREFLEFLNAARSFGERGAVSASSPGLVRLAEILADDRPSGYQIGRFTVLKELGRGGYGIVYLACDPALNRPVAVKIPRPEMLISRPARRRFLAEGRAIASLDHPHILKVFEAGETGAVCYIASEYCAGPTLQQWLADRGGPMEARTAAQVVADLADAVGHAHACGILHRDLKPSNVLLQPAIPVGGGNGDAGGLEAARGPETVVEFPFAVRLSDFGIAKALEHADDSTRTMTGTIVGTPCYMSPEQASGRTSMVGLRSDVYGLGALLYELLTAKPVFDGESRAAVLQRVLTEEPVRPRALRKEVPLDLEAICLKCLEKDQGRRYSTAAELRDDLRRFLAGKPVSARPLTAARRLVRWSRRKPTSAALVLLACVSLLGFAAGGWWHSLALRHEITLAHAERERANEGEAEARRQRLEAERQRAAVEEREIRLRRDLFCLDSHSAYRAVTGGRVDYAVELLRKYEGDPSVTSSFVWRFLWRLCHSAERVWSEPGMECYSVDFSPDGTRLAAGIENGTAPIWDVSTGKELMRLRGHTSCVNTVRFTPDGAHLLTASCDGTVRLWDAASGREERVLQRQKRAVMSLGLSADGLLLASGDDAGIVTMFHLPRGEKLGAGSIGGRRVEDLAFSWDGKWLAGACRDSLCLCDAQGPSKLVKWTQVARPGLGPQTVGFKPRGSLIAWAGTAGELHLGDLSNPLTEYRLPCRNKRSVLTLTFDSTGRRIACGGESQVVEVWDVEARRRIAEFYGHTNRIQSVAIDRDGRRVATAARDGTIRLWSMEK
jgi:serine/threonine protein kinase